jgi:hypothetical protein
MALGNLMSGKFQKRKGGAEKRHDQSRLHEKQLHGGRHLRDAALDLGNIDHDPPEIGLDVLDIAFEHGNARFHPRIMGATAIRRKGLTGIRHLRRLDR